MAVSIKTELVEGGQGRSSEENERSLQPVAINASNLYQVLQVPIEKLRQSPTKTLLATFLKRPNTR